MRGSQSVLEHDPEKWTPVFRKACPRARPEGSCSNQKIERDDDSKKSHHAPGGVFAAGRPAARRNPPTPHALIGAASSFPMCHGTSEMRRQAQAWNDDAHLRLPR